MRWILVFLFLGLCGFLGAESLDTSVTNSVTNCATNSPAPTELSSPVGYESFFPAGYTAPKMSVGSGGVAIVGPTPYFRSKTSGAGNTGAKVIQTGQPSSAVPLNIQDGNTELMLAATSGDYAKVKILLNKGADANAKNKFGSTALMGAAALGHAAIVEALLEKHANTNATGKNGYTALMFAARNGHKQVVTSLLNAGANAGLKDDRGRTAAYHAEEAGFIKIADYLKKGKDSGEDPKLNQTTNHYENATQDHSADQPDPPDRGNAD